MDQVVEAIKFILNNAFVQFSEEIYQQIIGIIMGGNACPEIADLYLIWCEYDYMQKLIQGKNKNLKLARELSNNSRYIDDISTLNHSINFGSLSKYIYDKSLILKFRKWSPRQLLRPSHLYKKWKVHHRHLPQS